MSKVFVIDTNKKPLDPVHPGRARMLLNQGKAAVFRRYPFTIILKYAVEATPEPLRVKIDPGSKATGIAIVDDKTGEVVFAAEITHRGQTIKNKIASRRAIRRGRRNRKTRYRKPRFLNRTRKEGWLPPSIESRVLNVETWVKRLMRVAPIGAISQELVKFDFQKMESPEIAGVEYQQGTLAGYELREYLLEKWGRTCAYCGKKDVSLEIEHIRPKSNGGSDRASNLTLACHECNQAKGNMPVETFLKDKPELLKHVLSRAKAPLKDAAAVNASRWNLFNRLKALGPVEIGSGGLTKFNRAQRGMEKGHWLDAACVGKSTPATLKIDHVNPLIVKATGYGKRQMCGTDKYGFPRQHRTNRKTFMGFQTGDMVKATIPKGKYQGVHTGRIMIRMRPSFRFNGFDVHPKYLSIVQHLDGYDYQNAHSPARFM